MLLDRGLVVKIGEDIMLDKGDSRTKVVQAHGSWLTPGIFDMVSGTRCGTS